MPQEHGEVLNFNAHLEAKQQLAGFETGQDEKRLVRETLKHQPAGMFIFLKEAYPDLKETWAPIFESGIHTELVVTYHEEGRQKVSGDDYAVHLLSHKGQLRPQLQVSVDAINQTAPLLEVFTMGREPEQEAREEQLRGAVALVSWMGLGKWIFDTIEPRAAPEGMSERARHALACQIAKTSSKDFKTLSDEEIADEVEKGLDIFRVRMMGSLGYIGMATELVIGDEDHEILRNLQMVTLIERICKGTYSAKIESGITPSDMDFALAFPLGGEQLDENLRLLAKLH